MISYVSADLSHDPQSETSYYTVRVTLPEEEHRRLAGLRLVSGMPAEIFVQTGSRTMLSYLLKPITDQPGGLSTSGEIGALTERRSGERPGQIFSGVQMLRYSLSMRQIYRLKR